MSSKKTTKKSTKKRAKVVMPKLNNHQCPAGMSLETWQIALRQQQVKKENFAISAAPVHLEDGIPTSTPSTDHTTPSSPCNPKPLITEGVSFLSGLAETLKSPEATQQLIDNIVEVNPETGETNLKIPVSSKEWSIFD